MKAPKLLAALALIKKEEWALLARYILSNTGENSINYKLFLKIKESGLSDLRQLDLNLVKSKYFVDTSDKAFANAMSKVFAWIEEWCVIQEMRHERFLPDLLLVKAYNRKGDYNLAQNAISRLEKNISKQEGYDLEKIEYLWKLNHELHFSSNPAKNLIGGQLLATGVDLCTKLFGNYLQIYTIEMISWGGIAQYDYLDQINTTDSILQLLPGSENDTIYSLLLKIVKDDSVDSLYKLIDVLLSDRFNSNSKLKTLVTFYLITKTLKFWNKGLLAQDSNLLLSLYNYGLDNGILFENGKISEVQFQNMICNVSFFSTFDEAEQFINQWIVKVNTECPKGTHNLAMAYNCFYHGKYDTLIEYARYGEFHNTSSYFRAKMLCLVHYYVYRENDYDLLYRSISNFRKSVKRRKRELSVVEYELFNNTSQLLEKLTTSDHKQQSIKIEDYGRLNFRSWCVREIEDYNNGGTL